MKLLVFPILLVLTVLAVAGCAAPTQPVTPVPTAIPTLPAPTQSQPTEAAPTLPPIPEPTRAAPSPTRPNFPASTPQVPPPIGNEPTPTPGGGTVITDPRLLQFVNDAKIDLSQRANVLPDEIKIISADPVEWRDGSLGCPKPGVMYTQVISSGYLIVLQAAGKEWNYHAGRDNVFYCEQ